DREPESKCYVNGATFEVNDAETDSKKCQYAVSRHEHNDMTRVLCHRKTNIDVWADAVDLRSSCKTCTGDCKCFMVLFHYTGKLAFSSITSAHQKFHELRCSYGHDRAHFGDGLYASQYAPEHFGSKLRVALNNYGSCDTDAFDTEPLCCANYWEDIRTKWAEAADFCIPILVPKGLRRDFQKEDYDYEDETGKCKIEAGRNLKGVKQHENRDVWIIEPPDKDMDPERRQKHWKSDTEQRLKLLEMRQKDGNLEGSYESKEEAKKVLKDHGVTGGADSGSMLKSLDHASWRHKALDKHFKLFYDSWKQGDLAVAQNRLAEFESLLERLPLKEKDHDRYTLKTYQAAVFSDQGNMEKAEELLEEVLKYRKKTRGEAHMETLACHDLLAKLFLNWRKFEKAEKHAQEALNGREGPDPDKNSDNLHVLRSRSFLQEILIEKAQSEESPLSEDVFEKAFTTMQDCATKMLPEEVLREPEFAESGYEDHRAALAMWNNAACVARRFAALLKVNGEKKKLMLQRADTIYALLYEASKQPGSWDHAVHHARIASNWALVLDLRKSTEKNPEKVLEKAIKTIEGRIKTLADPDT
ncbi:unnamed protein product, partial [Symbiodinium necroappetens]